MDFAVFLQEHEYIDFSSPLIIEKAKQLFNQINTDVEKAKIAFEYVRDEIPHSFDIRGRPSHISAINVKPRIAANAD